MHDNKRNLENVVSQVTKEYQVLKLMRGVQDSLTGRLAVFSLTSLSQAEIFWMI